MQDTLFIQFYSRRRNAIYNLLNGFSDAYDLCRRHGELFWMQDEADTDRWYQYDLYAAKPLPISRGTIYASALDVNHLYQCWVWARENPDVRFIVGGPAATERNRAEGHWDPAYLKVENRDSIPGNITFTGKSVEEWFGETDFSGPWKLDVPRDIPDGSRIYFSYTLDNTCFWSRCIYCNIGLHDKTRVRRRNEMNFEFRDLPFAGVKLVRLNTGSITPRQLKELIPALPRGNGLEYRTFMRPAAAENKALKEAVAVCGGSIPDLVLGFGVEFPSRRMLARVNKGFSPEEMLDGLAICSANGILVNGNVIVGWDDLEDNDIRELEDFLSKTPVGSFKNMQLRWLFAHPYTPIHEGRSGEAVRFGPFYEGFSVNLHEAKQIELNRQAVGIIERYAEKKKYKIDGLENVQARL